MYGLSGRHNHGEGRGGGSMKNTNRPAEVYDTVVIGSSNSSRGAVLRSKNLQYGTKGVY